MICSGRKNSTKRCAESSKVKNDQTGLKGFDLLSES